MEKLSEFFKNIRNDGRIGTTHISIYAALLQLQIQQEGRNPIQVFSRDVMEISRIASRTTFYQCVKDLNDYGYLRFFSSRDHRKGSRVHFK